MASNLFKTDAQAKRDRNDDLDGVRAVGVLILFILIVGGMFAYLGSRAQDAPLINNTTVSTNGK